MSVARKLGASAIGAALVMLAQTTARAEDKKEEKKPAPAAAPKPAELKPGEKPAAGGAPSEADMMKAMIESSAPGPHHDYFKKLVGKWKTTTKSMMGGEAPMSDGTAEYEMIMGGRFVKQTFKGSFMGMPFDGFGINGYDSQKKVHTGMWIDNMGTGFYVSEGSCDADHKVITETMSYNDPMTGQPTKSKMVIKFVDDNTFVFTMSKIGEDGKEQPEMEITYTRM